MFIRLSFIVCFILFNHSAFSVEVSTSKIRFGKVQLPLQRVKLSSGELTDIHILFKYGTVHDKKFQGVALDILTAMSDKGTKTFPKDKLNAALSHYSYQISCSGGLEYSQCALGSVNDYLQNGADILASMIYEPTLESEDFEVAKKNYIAGLKSSVSDPQFVARQLVNKIFYGNDHPYFVDLETQLKIAENLRLSDVKTMQLKLQRSLHSFHVVSSLPEETITETLHKGFSKFKPRKTLAPKVKIKDPKYTSRAKNIAHQSRDIPTAYMLLKFNAPELTSKEATAAKLMFRVLSEKIDEEVRTKRSLSYGTYANTLQAGIGIGNIVSTTPKPTETLAAISDVIDDVQKNLLSKEELDRYRNIYTTAYYLQQESGASLAAGIAKSMFYFDHGKADQMFLEELNQVNPDDIRRLARKYVKNFRLGIVSNDSVYSEKSLAKILSKHR